MKRIIGFAVFLGILFNFRPVSAQNYTTYTNTWQEICSYPGDPALEYPWDGQPLSSGFWPDGDFARPGGLRAFETTSPEDAADNPFHRAFSVPGSLPSQLGGNYTSSATGQCTWEAYSNTAVSGGALLAYTPVQDFSTHNVTRAEVGFLWYLNDPTGLSPRTYNIKIDWEKTRTPGEGTINTTYVNGEMGGGSMASWQTGYVWENIGIREGYKISSIQIQYPQPNALIYYVAPSILKLDRIIINGYQSNIGSTPTPAPTRTPTVGPTTTQTTTPRAIWSTPTPGTPQPTKQFPPHYGSIPTRIPPISFPDWASLMIPTPENYFSVPLIDTPVIPTRASFTFTIPISYSTPAAFVPPTAAPTATATPTVETPLDPCPLINNYSFDDGTGWTLYYGASISGGQLTLPGPAANAFQTVSFDAGNYGSVISVTSSASTQAWIVINGDNLGVFNPTAGPGLYYATNTNVPSGNYLLAITNVTGGELVIDEMCTSNLAEPTPTLTPAPTATRADIVASMNLVATNLYSEAAVMNNPTTFTIQTAPLDYAPALPRPMADIGYTFESMQGNIGFLYDPRAWASLLGYVASVPFQLVKFFYTLAQMMGPVGLFVTWLFILLPFVLFAKMFIFIKNLIISIINLIIKIIRFIGDIWDMFPGL